MSQELVQGCADAMQAAPIQTNLRGLLSVLGRGLSFIVNLPAEQLKSLSLEAIISILEKAFQIAVVDVNFEKIPDFIEDPAEAWAKAQIRPLATSLLGGYFMGS